MLMSLKRTHFHNTCTIGEIFIDGIFQCFSLEDQDREITGQPIESWKKSGFTAIPRGEYDIMLTHSMRFKRITPQLMNVRGFTGIRIHPGNTAADTEGCILPGLYLGNDRIGESKKAYDKLFIKIIDATSQGEKVKINISGKKEDKI